MRRPAVTPTDAVPVVWDDDVLAMDIGHGTARHRGTEPRAGARTRQSLDLGGGKARVGAAQTGGLGMRASSVDEVKPCPRRGPGPE
jgi:hypothetical protein